MPRGFVTSVPETEGRLFMRATCLWLTALALVAAVPGFAADPAIQNGIDLWHTPPDGSTYVDFAKTPVRLVEEHARWF